MSNNATITRFTAANDVTPERGLRDGYVTVHVSGTFTGTLTLRMIPTGPLIGTGAASTKLAHGTTITAPGIYTYGPFAGPWTVDVIATALASGTPDVALACGGISGR